MSEQVYSTADIWQDIYDPTTHSINTNGGSGGGGDVNLVQVNTVVVDVGIGAAGLGTQRVAVSSDSSIIVNQSNPANFNAQVVGNVAHDAVDSGNSVKTGYKAADPTSLATAVAVGDRVDAYGSTQGEIFAYLTKLIGGEDLVNNLIGILPKPIAGTTYTGIRTQNLSFTTLNLSAVPGNVLRIEVLNTTGSTRYFQLHNTATTPAGGATAQHFYLVPPNQQIILGPGELSDAGIPFTTGIAYANSTTASTYTAGSAGDLLLNIRHI